MENFPFYKFDTRKIFHVSPLLQKEEKLKKPNECQNMNDIREKIDRIDRNVISLISERAQYVNAASTFKKDKKAVKAPDRVKAILQKLAEWAKEKNNNCENIYRIGYFVISEEMSRWKKENKNL